MFRTVFPRNIVDPFVVTVVTFVPRSASRLTAILGAFEQPPAKVAANTAILMLTIRFMCINCAMMPNDFYAARPSLPNWTAPVMSMEWRQSNAER